uniref:Uncharacterized protein n=1 Tax=Strigamia maritima TaxID=126957 RepID=T1JMG6_STRMM
VLTSSRGGSSLIKQGTEETLTGSRTLRKKNALACQSNGVRSLEDGEETGERSDAMLISGDFRTLDFKYENRGFDSRPVLSFCFLKSKRMRIRD